MPNIQMHRYNTFVAPFEIPVTVDNVSAFKDNHTRYVARYVPHTNTNVVRLSLLF